MVRSNKSKNHKDPRMEPAKRLRANMRERQRVSQMNEMFDVLISLLPPSEFRLRLSRAQALREAAKYINQLVEHLETSDGSDSIPKFPHIFLENRQSKTVNYRTPVNSSSVTAFISRHDFLNPIVPQNPIYPLPPTTTFIISGSFEPFSMDNSLKNILEMRHAYNL